MEQAQWDEDVADIIEELIRRANSNQLPASEEEWKDICERFCVDLFIVRSRSRASGVLLDDILVVKRSLCAESTKSRIAHEFSEHLLSSDWHAPVVVPIEDLQEQRHHVAKLVEERIRAYSAQKRQNVVRQMDTIVKRRQALLRKLRIIQEQIAAEDELLRAAEELLE